MHWRKVSLKVGLSLAILLALEGAASVTEKPTKYRYSTTTGFELAPGYQRHGESVNSAGLRGAQIGKKRDDTLRILCIGGSTTWGHKLDDDETWPSLLQALLNKRGDGRFEVLNGGVSGWGLEQNLRALQDGRMRDLEPDLVLLYSGWNDALMEGNEQVLRFNQELPTSPRSHAFMQFALGRRALKWSRELAPAVDSSDVSDDLTRFAERNSRGFRELMPKLVEICSANDAQLAIIQFPGLVQRELPANGEALEVYEHALRYRYDAEDQTNEIFATETTKYDAALRPGLIAAEQLGIPILELANEMVARLPKAAAQADLSWSKYWRDPLHLLPPGNEVIAIALASLLAESELLD